MGKPVKLNANLTLQINDAAAQALLQSPEVAAWVESQASRIANNAGEGFDYGVAVVNHFKTPRTSAIVFAKTKQARLAQARDSALMKAITS